MTGWHKYSIVVGVDGSAASKEALRWALGIAERADGRITALQAWDLPVLYNWEVPSPQDFAQETANALRETVSEVVGETTIEISEEVAQGHPVRALLDAVHDNEADLLVVGNRGQGGFAGALLGSVSQYVVQHARCPVVIVGKP